MSLLVAFKRIVLGMQSGGLGWDVPAGRRDGQISLATETIDIPAPFNNLDQNLQAFAKKGL